MRRSRLRIRWASPARAGLALGLLLAAAGGAAQPPAGAPFAAGEVLTYRAVSSRFGTIGTGTMRVEGPEEVRGREALRLCFDFRGRMGPFRVEDRSRSWLVREEMASVRYERRERSPLGSHREEVEIFPDQRRWTAADGRAGEAPTPAPLDELSFIYFLRSLPLEEGESHALARHFDPERNPVVVRVLRRERVSVPAGDFATVVVEMRVKDQRTFAGNGALRLYLTDDARRIPVRIESSAPVVGAMTLLLERAEGGR